MGAVKHKASKQTKVVVAATSARVKSKYKHQVEPPESIVREPEAAVAFSARPWLEVIFKRKSATKTLRTPIEKMQQVREGVDKMELQSLKEQTGLGYDDLAKVLPATRATLIGKKGREKFNASVSDAIVGIADIYSYGYDIFGQEERFNRWMRQPLQALNGATPLSLLDNQFGREEVRNLIGRIAYGVYS